MTLKNTMVVNGKEYKIPEINFDTICRFEEMGVALDVTLSKKPLSTIRAFVGLVVDDPSKEITEHLKSGGTLEPIFDAFTKAVEKSDFFQGIAERATENTAKE
jgi:hypothetical protein